MLEKDCLSCEMSMAGAGKRLPIDRVRKRPLTVLVLAILVVVDDLFQNPCSNVRLCSLEFWPVWCFKLDLH